MIRSLHTNVDSEDLLAWRGIEGPPCPICHGSGVKMYGSTATWRGGLGGCSMTSDVCDQCWGSGDKDRPWIDLRALRDGEEERVRQRVQVWFAHRLGVHLTEMQGFTRRLADVIEKESRRRKVEFWWALACGVFANMLRELAKAPEGNVPNESEDKRPFSESV